MTPVEIRRLLLILQRERQKGFRALQQLAQMPDGNREGDEATSGGRGQPASPVIRLPLSARGDGSDDS